MIKQLLFLCLSTLFSWTCLGQNLLNTSTWTQGSGSVSGFSQNGSTSENWRILGDNHVGDEVILWEARNDSSSNADGGWNASSVPIDNTKNYRFTVWIKKTNSTDGTTYFGCKKTNQILDLSGSTNDNPYFWSGDLPQLNRWYLLVGYVYNKNYSVLGGSALGIPSGIYDGVTGERVSSFNMTAYKFASSATSVSHRAYLYYDTNTADRQYFYEPTIEALNGTESSFNELMQISPNSAISLYYDAAGNQTSRFYCSTGTNCRSSFKKVNDEVIVTNKSTDLREEDDSSIIEEEVVLDNSVTFYPNPTKGMINISMDKDMTDLGELSIYDLNGKIIYSTNRMKSKLSVDLTNYSIGTYIAHIHFTNGGFITKKIIKL